MLPIFQHSHKYPLWSYVCRHAHCVKAFFGKEMFYGKKRINIQTGKDMALFVLNSCGVFQGFLSQKKIERTFWFLHFVGDCILVWGIIVRGIEIIVVAVCSGTLSYFEYLK